MSKIENVVIGRYSFPSEESIGRDVNGQIERGGNFWGKLVGYDDTYLYLKGDKGQDVIVRRKNIAKLEVV